MIKKAILFDLDGTLLNTSEGIITSILQVIEKLDLPQISIENLLTFVGPPVQESFKRHYGMNDIDAQKAADLFRSAYKGDNLFKATLYPGIINLLNELKQNNRKIAVATYKRHDYAVTLLDKFGISAYCDSIHGGDNTNKLTKSDIILQCIEDFSLTPEQCVLIGDTAYDAIGAQKIGMDFIGVAWGFGFKSFADIEKHTNIGLFFSVDDLKDKLLINE